MNTRFVVLFIWMGGGVYCITIIQNKLQRNLLFKTPAENDFEYYVGLT